MPLRNRNCERNPIFIGVERCRTLNWARDSNCHPTPSLRATPPRTRRGEYQQRTATAWELRIDAKNGNHICGGGSCSSPPRGCTNNRGEGMAAGQGRGAVVFAVAVAVVPSHSTQSRLSRRFSMSWGCLPSSSAMISWGVRYFLARSAASRASSAFFFFS